MPEPNFRNQTEEELYTFTYVTAITDAIDSGHVTITKDAITSAAKQLNVDLSEKDDTTKLKEAYIKVSMDYLLSRGLIEETKVPGKYSVSRDFVKRKEYGELMFAARCKQQEKDVAKAIAAFVKLAISSHISPLTLIAGALKLSPFEVADIEKSLLTVIGTLENFTDKVNETLQAVREHIVKDILHFESHEPTNTLAKKSFSALSKEVNEEIEKKLKSFNEVEGPTIAKANFSDKRKEEVERNLKKNFEKDPPPRDILKDCAEYAKGVLTGDAYLIYDALLEINDTCNADGKVPINNGPQPKNHIPQMVSIAAVLKELTTELLAGSASRGLLSLSSLLHRGDDSKIKTVRMMTRFANTLVYGADNILTKAVKKISQHEFTQAEYAIRDYNIKESGARERGENFAKIYGSLNVYRAGRAEYVTGAFNAFKMRPDDKMWAMSYMIAGTHATKAGVLYAVTIDGKLGNKEQIAVKHDAELEQNAKKVYEKYAKLSEKIGIDKTLDAMEKDFIGVHHKALEASKKMREEEGLPPLNPKTHFNHIYDNAPVKEFDYIKVVNMTKEEYKTKNLNQVFIDNDAILIEGENTLSLQLLGENHVVTAVVNGQNQAIIMGMADHALEPDYHNRDNACIKASALLIIDLEESMLITAAYRKMYAATFGNQEVGSESAYKWIDVVNTLAETRNYTAYVNWETDEFGFKDKRTGIKVRLTNQEPNVEISDKCMTLVHFAKDVMRSELKNLCEEREIEKEDIEQLYAPLTFNLSPAEKRIAARADPEHKLEALKEITELITDMVSVQSVIDTKQRAEIINKLNTQLDNMDELSMTSEKVSDELKTYRAFELEDHDLAICRSCVPECEREGNNIVAYTSNGERLAINIETYEMEGFDRQNAEMRELKNKLFMALDEISENAGYELEEDMLPDMPEAER